MPCTLQAVLWQLSLLWNENKDDGGLFWVWPIKLLCLYLHAFSPFLRIRTAIIKAILEDIYWSWSGCDKLRSLRDEADSSITNTSNLENSKCEKETWFKLLHLGVSLVHMPQWRFHMPQLKDSTCYKKDLAQTKKKSAQLIKVHNNKFSCYIIQVWLSIT